MPPPTVPQPGSEGLSGSLKRNIEVLKKRRENEAAAASREEKVAEAITSFTGSMRFVYLHLALRRLDPDQPRHSTDLAAVRFVLRHPSDGGIC